MSKNNIEASSICECFGVTGTLRPDIVWFGEIPKSMDVIESLLASCDLFISIGSSGTVYPAAGFKQVANSFGAETVELNLEASTRYFGFDESRYGPATETVPTYFNELSERLNS